MNRWTRYAGVALLLVLQSAPFARAETPEEKGLAIAVKADQADSGWGDQTSNMTMILRNRNGDESIRKIRSKALEVKGDGDKSL
ncbi:MAG: outer membrane lipoprotein-sorting protein, partial [Deltaproteobacteria bacterium]